MPGDLADVLAVGDHVGQGRDRLGVARRTTRRGTPASPRVASGRGPAACAASTQLELHAAHSAFTKPGTKVTMQTPPLSASRAEHVVGDVARVVATARAEEWEKITGASVASSAARIVVAATWERSTIIPSRFISRTTSTPNADSPPTHRVVGGRVGPRGVVVVGERQVADAERRWSIRSAPSEQPMEWPPSAPSSEAIRPSRQAASTSSAVVARASRSAYRSTSAVHAVDLLERRRHRRVARGRVLGT